MAVYLDRRAGRESQPLWRDSFGTVSAPEKSGLVHAIYERVIVAGPEIRSVRLTAAAKARGLALALPEQADGAPDRCWARDINLRDPDRGPR